MMGRRSALENLAPWAGLIGAVVGWFGAHEIGFYTAFDHCVVGRPLALFVSLVGLGIAIGSSSVSWLVWRRGSAESDARRFAALVSTLVAVTASFALLLQIAAGIILPGCFG